MSKYMLNGLANSCRNFYGDIFSLKRNTMKFDDDIEIPDGDFNPGIYNYCNSWCERCLYTDKCLTYASEKKFRREIEAKKIREKSIAENKDFWDQVNTTINESADLIDEEIPLKKKDLSIFFDDFEEDKDAEEAMKEHREKHTKAKRQEMSKVALKYQNTVHKWFEDRKNILKQEYNPESEVIDVNYALITDELELKLFTEMVEVVQWYHIQLWIKINRALSSSYEEEEDPELFKDNPKDSDGSAMVALMGINSSIGAWNYLLSKLTSEKETIKPLIRMLLYLKMEIEKKFPGALDFVWPPKSKEE